MQHDNKEKIIIFKQDLQYIIYGGKEIMKDQ